MKRLVPLLILVVFCLGSLGGRTFHLHHHLQKSPSSHRGLHFAILPSADDCYGDLDEGGQPLGPAKDLNYTPEPGGHGLAAGSKANSTATGQDYQLGLGCGGLPA